MKLNHLLLSLSLLLVSLLIFIKLIHIILLNKKRIVFNVENFLKSNEYAPDKKILNLILYSDTGSNASEYKQMYKVLSKYLKFLNIPHFFYTYKKDLDTEYRFEDNILYIKGVESFVPGCLDKTLKAFNICYNLEFDYIIRSNISEIVDFTLLKPILNRTSIDYGGPTHIVLTWFDPKMGIYNAFYWGTNYIQGNAIILSRKTVKLIMDNAKKILDYGIIDDAAIGYFLKDYMDKIILFHDELNATHKIKNIIFYRNKSDDRLVDAQNMNQIINELIGLP